MANLTPDRDLILEGVRRFIDTLYVEPAVRLGRPVWGLKEVRYTLADVRRLRVLYPGVAVIMLVRDPRDVLRSLDEWERKTDGRWTRRLTEDAVVNWGRVAEDFLAPAEDGPPVLRLRYEDLVADPGGACESIARHTGLDAGGFDPEVLGTRVYAGEEFARLPRDLREWRELPESLRQLLDRPRMRSLMDACGYRSMD
jgi:hypothetical protein